MNAETQTTPKKLAAAAAAAEADAAAVEAIPAHSSLFDRMGGAAALEARPREPKKQVVVGRLQLKAKFECSFQMCSSKS